MESTTNQVFANRLVETALHSVHTVERVVAPEVAPEWADWLAEIGFLPGESVSIMALGAFGGDPLVVRVGNSTFALRRAEAACVIVRPEAARAANYESRTVARHTDA